MYTVQVVPRHQGKQLSKLCNMDDGQPLSSKLTCPGSRPCPSTCHVMQCLFHPDYSEGRTYEIRRTHDVIGALKFLEHLATPASRSRPGTRHNFCCCGVGEQHSPRFRSRTDCQSSTGDYLLCWPTRRKGKGLRPTCLPTTQGNLKRRGELELRVKAKRNA